MKLAHTPNRKPGIGYQEWQQQIQAAADIDQLLKTVRLYLAAWTPEQLELLPADIAATALTGCDAIVTRALMANKAELSYRGDAETHRALEQMALTLAAAAGRLRMLEAYRSLA